MAARDDPQSAVRSLQTGICVLIVVGYFGPWIPHKTAALTVTGYELSEFAKFFPQVQGGTVPVVRALFVTPLVAAALSIGLLVNGTVGRFLLRLVTTGTAALLSLAVLPPLESIRASQYRLQLALALSGSLFVLLTLLSRRFSPYLRGGLIMLLALAGVVPALSQFILLRPLVVDLYRTSIGLGWGLIACVVGFGTLFLSEVLVAVRPGRSMRLTS